MRYFCTYFDRNYVSRALALYNSLAACQEDFHLFMLCMDEEAVSSLKELALSRVTISRLRELEEASPVLLEIKGQRSRVEYYYTCGPSYLLYVLLRHPEIDILTYLDADLFFFSTPEPLFAQFGDASVGIIEHRFKQESLKRFGTFNVGWISFRANVDGLACLQWWAGRCVEWCYDRVEGGRFADQKYLDDFPRLFNRVRILQHPGANLAPWNLGTHVITRKGDTLLVDGQTIIFFHFHGFKMVRSWLFDTNMGGYSYLPNNFIRKNLFGSYARELTRVQRGTTSPGSLREVDRVQSRGYGALMAFARRCVHVSLGLLRNAYIVDWSGLVPK